MVRINIGKWHGILAVAVIALVLGIGTGGAQIPDPSHTWREIGIPTGVWTGVTAENVAWQGVTGKPSTSAILVGICEDAKDTLGQWFCGSDQKDYLNDPVGEHIFCYGFSVNMYGHENKRCAVVYPHTALEWNYSREWGSGVTKIIHLYYEII